jgi:hypothetical protein
MKEIFQKIRSNFILCEVMLIDKIIVQMEIDFYFYIVLILLPAKTLD